jgi:hypothetical protein
MLYICNTHYLVTKLQQKVRTKVSGLLEFINHLDLRQKIETFKTIKLSFTASLTTITEMIKLIIKNNKKIIKNN